MFALTLMVWGLVSYRNITHRIHRIYVAEQDDMQERKRTREREAWAFTCVFLQLYSSLIRTSVGSEINIT